jgi:hypothetical protein
VDAARQVAAKAVNPADSQVEESKATARKQAVAAGRKEVDARAEVTVSTVSANLLNGGGEFKRLALAVSDLILERDFLVTARAVTNGKTALHLLNGYTRDETVRKTAD